MWGEVCGAGRRERAAAATQGARTLNMEFMLQALDVSKLSGWSKAVASCAESKAWRAMPRARCAGRKARELGRGPGAGARGGPAIGGLRAERAANVYRPGRAWGSRGRKQRTRRTWLEGCVGARHARRSARRT